MRGQSRVVAVGKGEASYVVPLGLERWYGVTTNVMSSSRHRETKPPGVRQEPALLKGNLGAPGCHNAQKARGEYFYVVLRGEERC